MNILKNKHMILAMFVAPVLAIIAYFSVDYIVSETPQTAQRGGSYKLAAKSNCRYKSGACTLKNGDVEVQMRARRLGDSMVELTIHSDLPIQNAIISHVFDEIVSEPLQIAAVSDEIDDRQVTLELADPEQSTLRLAFYIYDSIYFTETSAVFVDFETSFSRENFAE